MYRCCSANAAPFRVFFEAQFQLCQGTRTLTACLVAWPSVSSKALGPLIHFRDLPCSSFSPEVIAVPYGM